MQTCLQTEMDVLYADRSFNVPSRKASDSASKVLAFSGTRHVKSSGVERC